MDIAAVKDRLNTHPEVVAAFLFGSASDAGVVANDIDILLLLRPQADKMNVYIELKLQLGEALGVPGDKIDILFFDFNEVDPVVLARAVNNGILVKNEDPQLSTDSIETLSLHLLQNEPARSRAKQLRQELIEEFCAS